MLWFSGFLWCNTCLELAFKLMRASWNIFPSPRSIRIIAWAQNAVPETYGGQRLCLASPFPGSSTVPVTEQVSLNVCWTQPNKRIMFGVPVQCAFCHLPTSSVTGSESCSGESPFSQSCTHTLAPKSPSTRHPMSRQQWSSHERMFSEKTQHVLPDVKQRCAEKKNSDLP